MELTEDQVGDIHDILLDYMTEFQISEAIKKIKEVLKRK